QKKAIFSKERNCSADKKGIVCREGGFYSVIPMYLIPKDGSENCYFGIDRGRHSLELNNKTFDMLTISKISPGLMLAMTPAVSRDDCSDRTKQKDIDCMLWLNQEIDKYSTLSNSIDKSAGFVLSI